MTFITAICNAEIRYGYNRRGIHSQATADQIYPNENLVLRSTANLPDNLNPNRPADPFPYGRPLRGLARRLLAGRLIG
jgi:hypothetical protein